MKQIQQFKLAVLLVVIITGAGCKDDVPHASPPHSVIPNPMEFELAADNAFMINAETGILVDPTNSGALNVAGLLADLVGNTLDTMPAISTAGDFINTIELTKKNADLTLGPEGYELNVRHNQIIVRANADAGLFYGVQTIRQLLPPLVEYTAAYVKPLPVPALDIKDAPRYTWRGAMLDVSRHFLSADDVKRFIDLMALYKMNRLHLHLSDDQGWRIEIPSRPRLTAIGGRSQVGGKGGGFYTVEEFRDIVEYAANRYITIVPEIDLPGHINAALASYAEINCDNIARELYTGTEVGFSSVCPEKQETWIFIDDVIKDLAALSPGPWLHIGGDEVKTLTEEQYITFIERVQELVHKHGKQLVGWDEVLTADLAAGSIAQLWRPLWPNSDTDLDNSHMAAINAFKARVNHAINRNVSFIVSPANKLYLDMKYDDETIIGLKWAGLSNARNCYDWKIEDLFSQIPESSIAGVEATLWSESLGSIHDFEYMAFPRLPGVAELGWSQSSRRNWDEYKYRLSGHDERWSVLGVNYNRTDLVPW